MFEFNPDMVGDDEGEEGEDALAGYRRQDVSRIPNRFCKVTNVLQWKLSVKGR